MFGALLRPVDRLAEHVHEPVLADRLFEEVERPGLTGLDGARDRALPADDDDFRPGIDLFEAAQQLYSVHVRKHQVGDDHIRTPLFEDFLATGTNEGGANLVAFGFDDHLQPFGHRGLVVNGQDTFAAFAWCSGCGRHLCSYDGQSR